MIIPEIQTNTLDNALLVTDEYLDYIVIRDGINNGIGQSRKDLIMQYYPNIKIVKVKVVEIEEGWLIGKRISNKIKN